MIVVCDCRMHDLKNEREVMGFGEGAAVGLEGTTLRLAALAGDFEFLDVVNRDPNTIRKPRAQFLSPRTKISHTYSKSRYASIPPT